MIVRGAESTGATSIRRRPGTCIASHHSSSGRPSAKIARWTNERRSYQVRLYFACIARITASPVVGAPAADKGSVASRASVAETPIMRPPYECGCTTNLAALAYQSSPTRGVDEPAIGQEPSHRAGAGAGARRVRRPPLLRRQDRHRAVDALHRGRARNLVSG